MHRKVTVKAGKGETFLLYLSQVFFLFYMPLDRNYFPQLSHIIPKPYIQCHVRHYEIQFIGLTYITPCACVFICTVLDVTGHRAHLLVFFMDYRNINQMSISVARS